MSPVCRGIASVSEVAVFARIPASQCDCSPFRHTIANLCPNCFIVRKGEKPSTGPLTGQLPGEPHHYLPARDERYARECLLPPRAFRALADRPDTELAERFSVPLEQIHKRRADLPAIRPAPRARADRRRRGCVDPAARALRPRQPGEKPTDRA
jgi:hypothetical protein